MSKRKWQMTTGGFFSHVIFMFIYLFVAAAVAAAHDEMVSVCMQVHSRCPPHGFIF